MRTRLRAIALVAISSGLAFAGCELTVNDEAGKTCVTANDCPRELVCVAARPGEGKTCEALALPEVVSPAVDAGFADYCHDVKPVLDTYCVSCHGVPPAGGAPPTFRLDVYESDGGLPGAKAEAQRIFVRAVQNKDMPPPPNPPVPPAGQAAISAWVSSGAPFCDGGT